MEDRKNAKKSDESAALIQAFIDNAKAGNREYLISDMLHVLKSQNSLAGGVV